MASIDGTTNIKLQELIESNIISGSVVGGHLLLVTRGGAIIDAGFVAGSDPLFSWPIGSIYMGTTSANPSTLLGGGTWVRFGQGRVFVSQDGSQTEFDTVGETGGEKTHVLTAAELAAHTHTINHDHAAVTSASGGAHTHAVARATAVGTSTGVARGGTTASTDGATVSDGVHTHSVDVAALTGSSGSAGSDTAHNNLQPYIVVYAWTRTA